MESLASNNAINAIKEVRKLLNDTRSNLSREETKRTSKKLYRKETVYNFLREKEQKGSLTNKEKKLLKNVGRYQQMEILTNGKYD